MDRDWRHPQPFASIRDKNTEKKIKTMTLSQMRSNALMGYSAIYAQYIYRRQPTGAVWGLLNDIIDLQYLYSSTVVYFFHETAKWSEPLLS